MAFVTLDPWFVALVVWSVAGVLLVVTSVETLFIAIRSPLFLFF